MGYKSFQVAHLAKLKEMDLERKLTLRIGVGGKYKESGRIILNYSTNDYLNFSADTIVKDEDLPGSRSSAMAACSSRLVSGTLNEHLELEDYLARFFSFPACLVFGAGYLANIGSIPALVRRSDSVFSDKRIHASLIDGVTLSRAKHHRFLHNDVTSLERLLKATIKTRKADERYLIVTESVFSMDGDLAPLSDLIKLAMKYDALIFVDEAHAIGVFGDKGQGRISSEKFSIDSVICSGTLSKSISSYGGIVMSSVDTRDLLINTARAFIYNTALPPIMACLALRSFKKLTNEPGLGFSVLESALDFRNGLREMGFNVGNSESQIVPIIIGDNRKTLSLSQMLAHRGIIAVAIREPTVPRGSARLRFSVTAAHSKGDLENTKNSLFELGKELEII